MKLNSNILYQELGYHHFYASRDVSGRIPDACHSFHCCDQ